MAESWTNSFIQTFPDSINTSKEKQIQIFDISITDNPVLMLMRSVLDKAVRENTPLEKHSYTLTTYSPGSTTKDYREQLGISNSKTCYVYLLDRKARIRWHAVGAATPQELQTLERFTKQLLE